MFVYAGLRANSPARNRGRFGSRFVLPAQRLDDSAQLEQAVAAQFFQPAGGHDPRDGLPENRFAALVHPVIHHQSRHVLRGSRSRSLIRVSSVPKQAFLQCLARADCLVGLCRAGIYRSVECVLMPAKEIEHGEGEG